MSLFQLFFAILVVALPVIGQALLQDSKLAFAANLLAFGAFKLLAGVVLCLPDACLIRFSLSTMIFPPLPDTSRISREKWFSASSRPDFQDNSKCPDLDPEFGNTMARRSRISRPQLKLNFS
jgi:hypothetical protein